MSKTPAAKDDSSQFGVKVAMGFFAFVQVLVYNFGWAGTAFVLFIWFLNQWATADQKQRIVETYVLGTGVHRVVPIIVTSFLFCIILFAQQKWYDRDKKKMLANIGEMEKENAELKGRLKQQPVRRSTKK